MGKVQEVGLGSCPVTPLTPESLLVALPKAPGSMAILFWGSGHTGLVYPPPLFSHSVSHRTMAQIFPVEPGWCMYRPAYLCNPPYMWL